MRGWSRCCWSNRKAHPAAERADGLRGRAVAAFLAHGCRFDGVEVRRGGMSRSDPLGDYAALLGIRAKGYGRNSGISGFLFLLAFAAFIVSKWAGGAEGRSQLLAVVVIVPLGVTWLTPWGRP